MSRGKHIELFRTVRVLPDWEYRVGVAEEKARSFWDRYVEVERNTGVPWAVIAAIHMRESGGDMTRQILNGQLVSETTTMVPKGHGPWRTWADSAVDALRIRGVQGTEDWDLVMALEFMERWNGWGYKNRDKNSPYLWSGCQHGEGVGKFVADGTYVSTAEDKQVGAAVLLHRLMTAGLWSPGPTNHQLPVFADNKGEFITQRARMFQEGLNVALAGTLIPPLVVDGWCGQKTQVAFKHLTGLEME